MLKQLVFGAVLLVTSASSSGAIIFAEDFGSGANAIDQITINSNWNVTSGKVDLWNFFAAEGLSVDLDGSAENATITSSTLFSFSPGVLYQLSFSLGNNTTANNILTYSIGNIFNDVVGPSIAGIPAFSTITKQFSVASTTVAALVFSEQGPEDFGGSVIDNIVIRTVEPVSAAAPATFFLFIIAAGLGVFRSRHLTRLFSTE